jgi:hypothetical protein
LLNGGLCGGVSQRRKVAKGMARVGFTTKDTESTKVGNGESIGGWCGGFSQRRKGAMGDGARRV